MARMDQGFELHELRNRVITLEEQVDFLLKHFGLTYYPKPEFDNPKIIELLRKRKMIEAIQAYHLMYPGIDLADAKRAVEEIKLRNGL